MLPEFVKPVGGFVFPNSRGELGNTLSLDNVVSPWREAVHTLVALLKEHLGQELQSVYIRGSIARGDAREGLSDLDSLVIVKTVPDLLDRRWMPDLERAMRELFPFLTGVEIVLLPYEDMVNGCTLNEARFYLTTSSVCVFGESVQGKLPPFLLDKDLAAQLYGTFPKNIEQMQRYLHQSKSPEDRQKDCVWFCKRLLRTAFALVMEKQQRFTRDLYWCYQGFVEEFPDKAPWAERALVLALRPSSDPADLRELVEEFAPWVAGQFTDRFS